MFSYIIISSLIVILLSTKLLLINEETFILVSFSLFFYYAIKNLSPQVSESIDSQISKMESVIKSNFMNVKQDYIYLEKISSSLTFKSQILNLQNVVKHNINEIFKYKSYNILSNLKNTQALGFQIIRNLETSVYKLIYISTYIEVSKIINSKQYWLANFSEKPSVCKSQIENQELLSKI